MRSGKTQSDGVSATQPPWVIPDLPKYVIMADREKAFASFRREFKLRARNGFRLAFHGDHNLDSIITLKCYANLEVRFHAKELNLFLVNCFYYVYKSNLEKFCKRKTFSQ